MGVTEGQFKPSVEIPPSQAYGEKEIIQSIPLEEVIGPKNQYVPLKHLGPKLLEEVPVSLLEEAGQKVKAGATFTLTGADSQITKGKILSVTHEIAKVEIENPLAPFGSKKITKGLVGKSGLAKVTVLSLSGSDAQLSIEPLFYADLTPGKKVSIPNGESFIVESKTEKELKIRVPNTHDLAGKTLIFDLYIRSITSAPKEASANEKK
jgi:FKBP-type peptidyl-prolyl cis-trans isomerase 2